MKTSHILNMRFIPKRNVSKKSKFESAFLPRILSLLLRDLLPSLIILIIISICASLVAEKIYTAKASRSHTISMVAGDSHQKSTSPHGELKTDKVEHD